VALRRVLVELSVVEQRYRAVLEVHSGPTVSEVAAWFGVRAATFEVRRRGGCGDLGCLRAARRCASHAPVAAAVGRRSGALRRRGVREDAGDGCGAVGDFEAAVDVLQVLFKVASDGVEPPLRA
jgi:hypothetical protein